MSKVAITLIDQPDGQVAIEITVTNFDETSNAIGLGECVQAFIGEVSQQRPKAEQTASQLYCGKEFLAAAPKIEMVK